MATANRVRKKTQPQKGFRLAVRLKLVEKDLSVTGLARELGLARNTVSIAINHESMLPRVKERIGRFLGL
jgi:plasmid maintenance system antidote protein VapI